MIHRGVILCAMLVALPVAVRGEDWPGFRGPGARGVAADSPRLPARWSATDNVLWKRDLPGRGWSSPVVHGRRVILTTAVASEPLEEPRRGLYFGGHRDVPPDGVLRWLVLCLDLDTGATLWEREVAAGPPPDTIHIKNSYASETPVTDGERIYARFGNVGVFCLDMDGAIVWQRRFASRPMRSGWGPASSPALHRGRLYLVDDNEEESSLASLDARTGGEIWRVARDEKSNWATPFVWENQLRTEIVTPGSGRCRGYDLDGRLLWELAGASGITIATPYVAHGLLYLSSGYVLDRNKPIWAVRPGAAGDITLADGETANAAIAWSRGDAAPYNPGTLVFDDLLYVLSDRGLFACYDARTGETVYSRERLPEGRAFTASPWAYNGLVFCGNEYGETFVIRAGRRFELLHRNVLADEDMLMATPAVAGDRLLIRTEGRVYCLQHR